MRRLAQTFFFNSLWHVHPHLCTLRIYTHITSHHIQATRRSPDTHIIPVSHPSAETQTVGHTLIYPHRLPCAIWLSSVISLRGCEGVCVCVCALAGRVCSKGSVHMDDQRNEVTQNVHTHTDFFVSVLNLRFVFFFFPWGKRISAPTHTLTHTFLMRWHPG